MAFSLCLMPVSAISGAPEPAAYPDRPIRLIIPAPKGGGADVSFRILAEAMEPILGQKFQIVNKPDNGAVDGLTDLASAAPDGYTLAAVWNGPLTASPNVRDVPYSLKSFTAVASTFEAFYTLCARKDFPAETGQELVALLRQKPLGYKYGNEGKGGSGYFAAERLFEELGVVLHSKSFNGSTEVAKKFADKSVDFYFGTSTAISPLVANGFAKCLIVTANERQDSLPSAATLPELGLKVEPASLWRLIIAPTGLSPERLGILEKAIRKAMNTPAMLAFLDSHGEKADVHNGAMAMARLKAEAEIFAALADKLLLEHEPSPAPRSSDAAHR